MRVGAGSFLQNADSRDSCTAEKETKCLKNDNMVGGDQ
jgi:hypothetical protein